MLAYSVLMFIISVVLIILGILFYKGNIQLMRKYHQRKVKDTLAYGKALGKAYFTMSISPFISGIVGLLGDTTIIIVIAVIIFFIGIIVGVCSFVNVQEKFTAGFF